jgi:tRNA (guanine-N7-)-methyltransferase
LAKRKLQRFAENETLSNVIQPSREELLEGFSLKGDWRKNHFKNENPIVLELGCGKGEYTVGLARKFPNKNFIGIDVKGARMWRGAKTSIEEGLGNASFLRIQIEMLEYCFAKNEVDEIWITFPDPQLKFKRARKRLTAPMFLDRYRKILKEEGVMHLKTDSAFLHGYTLGLIEILGYTVIRSTCNLYESDVVDDIRSIQTYYEAKYLEQGIPITYIRFQLNG